MKTLKLNEMEETCHQWPDWEAISFPFQWGFLTLSFTCYLDPSSAIRWCCDKWSFLTWYTFSLTCLWLAAWMLTSLPKLLSSLLKHESFDSPAHPSSGVTCAMIPIMAFSQKQPLALRSVFWYYCKALVETEVTKQKTRGRRSCSEGQARLCPSKAWSVRSQSIARGAQQERQGEFSNTTTEYLFLTDLCKQLRSLFF